MRRVNESGECFSIERDPQGVALVTFDIPGERVNTLSKETGRQLDDLLSELSADSSVKAMVLMSGKPDSFIAGANVEELRHTQSSQDGERLARQAQAGFDRLQSMRFPVVAAIHGACLGGGLEWTLACTYRLATDDPKTSLGLPEVTLGLIPAAGGTQRLPRLIGVQAALDLILTGKKIRAAKAHRLGLIDEVVPAPLLRQVALARAAELASGKKPQRPGVGLTRLKGKKPRGILQGLFKGQVWSEAALEKTPFGRSLMWRQARERTLAKTGGHYPAPLTALEAVRAGIEGGLERGLETEAKAFGELVVSSVSRRLVDLFFAQTALKKEQWVEGGVEPRSVEKIGVLGAGLMGSGIAYVSLNSGLHCRIKDRDLPSVQRGLLSIRGILDDRVRRRSLGPLEANAIMAKVTGTIDLSGLRSADLVIEAVFEDLSIKQQVLREVEAACEPETLFASNTSSIPIGRIAQASQRPQNVIGMHYFSPVEKMPLLEVVTTPKTSPQTLATAVAVGKRQGKTVIVVNDGPGFYTTRIVAPYMNEAIYLLAEGISALEIDQALAEFGFPVGPITLLDEIGIDVAAKVAHILQEELGDRLQGPAAFEAMVRDGRLGRKVRKGFYRYDPDTGKKLKEIDETVYELFPGRAPRGLERAAIANRVILQMVNEAVRCLGEGILRSPRDGDVGAVFGLGFPPFRGGPFRWVDEEGLDAIRGRLETLAERHGSRFAPAPLLVDLAKASKRFYSA
jgi:3-hydroxyacyl-CoA dehydrogenase/enoyl-CoA hydratase/3-hydroxybutyryl-CoA epimerase